MKFHQIQNGQRFIYKDQVYIKVSPVLAQQEQSGEQKFLRRADNVEGISNDDTDDARTTVRRHIAVSKVNSLFDSFYRQLLAAIDDELSQLPAADRARLQARIQQQAQAFVQQISATGAGKKSRP